ncbi:unnamed protein product [Nippostrongylus brasiliensis]|uniref:Uncharacterized protein n=1 Tax=Nippostrongylus brasiliensis TaxID=27835 RepID=A0A0N4XD90_NIPBR|nr:unnamed protein product [Nippostrongylus brasiliensis]
MYQILLSATLLTTTFASYENNPININFDNCTRSPPVTVIVTNDTVKETLMKRIPRDTIGFHLELNDQVTSYITFTQPNYLFVKVKQFESWDSYFYGEVNKGVIIDMMQDIQGGHYKKAINCAEYSTTLNNDEPRASKKELDPESAYGKEF